MSAEDAKKAAELFDAFIKSEWQDIFRHEVHVRLDNGTRYVPNSGPRGVQLLRPNVNAFDEAVRIWSGTTDDPDSGTQGYDRIVDQVGVKYTWEWFLIDPDRPWASHVPPPVRRRVEADLARRSRGAVGRAQARTEEASRETEREADKTVTVNERQTCGAGQVATDRATGTSGARPHTQATRFDLVSRRRSCPG